MLEDLVITDNARIAHNEVMQWLKNNNYVCLREVKAMSFVEKSQMESGGSIDVIALKGGKRIAIEIDNRIPRHKSLYKLEHYKADERYVLLRGGNKNYNMGNVKVISLKLKDEVL